MEQVNPRKELLLELAKEYDEAFAYERERIMTNYPLIDYQFMARSITRGELFQQLGRMMRERADLA